MPALYFVNVPDPESNDASPPTAKSSLPTATENSTIGVGVKPMLDLKPAWSCKYCKSTLPEF
eukprot:Gb_17768 [translate_table: standard]